MSEQDTQSGGEIRLPRLVIPLGVDPGELEVYLETLKNSSMVKGVGDSSNPLAAMVSPDTNQSPASGAGSSTAGNEAAMAGLTLTLADILRVLQNIDGKMDVIMGAVLNG